MSVLSALCQSYVAERYFLTDSDESVPILLGAFKNAPQFPEAELEIGGGVRLGGCLTYALTPNPHIQLNITQHKPIAFNSTSRSHFWFHSKQIP
jgi:hypothetical protein